MSTGECLGSYNDGCRCDPCRRYKMFDQRNRYRRRKFGIEASTDWLPVGPTQAALLRMKSPSVPWKTVADALGMDRTHVNEIAIGKRKYVTRETAERVAQMEKRFIPVPGERMPSDHASWMLGALMAQGWESRWIGEQVGWTPGKSTKLGPSDLNPLITVEFHERILGVFLAHCDSWGPSRQGAVRMWRRGHFPAYCYEWDTALPDFRPIPGTMNPEHVVEAARYWDGDPEKEQKTLARLAELGQWPDERCARTALRRWVQETGREQSAWVSGRNGKAGMWCPEKYHRCRSLPFAWREKGRVA